MDTSYSPQEREGFGCVPILSCSHGLRGTGQSPGSPLCSWWKGSRHQEMAARGDGGLGGICESLRCRWGLASLLPRALSPLTTLPSCSSAVGISWKSCPATAPAPSWDPSSWLRGCSSKLCLTTLGWEVDTQLWSHWVSLQNIKSLENCRD